MLSRQTLPSRWLMTDRRLGDEVWGCIDRLPRGAGVVLRHHESDPAIGERVAAACARRHLVLAVAGDVGFARQIGATLVHNPDGDACGLLISRSVHDARNALAARRSALAFVSAVHSTASHPGAAALGLASALELARLAGVPAIALGGMDEEAGARAIAAGFHGWAGIDAWRISGSLRS